MEENSENKKEEQESQEKFKNLVCYVEIEKMKVVLVGGYLDGSLKTFDMLGKKKEVECSATFHKHIEPITMVKYSTEHKLLILASKDFKISCWQIAVKEDQLVLNKKFYIYAHHH